MFNQRINNIVSVNNSRLNILQICRLSSTLVCSKKNMSIDWDYVDCKLKCVHPLTNHHYLIVYFDHIAILIRRRTF